jgi:hypothetical protein
MVATGQLQWAKVLGAPVVDEYNPEGLWSIDLIVDDKEKKRLEKEGLKSKQKDPNTFNFKLPAMTNKGLPNRPPTIVDANKQPWDMNTLIGNGSTGNVSFFTYEHKMTPAYGLGKRLKAVQVVEHVPYESKEPEGVAEFEAVGGDVDEF